MGMCVYYAYLARCPIAVYLNMVLASHRDAVADVHTRRHEHGRPDTRGLREVVVIED